MRSRGVDLVYLSIASKPNDNTAFSLPTLSRVSRIHVECDIKYKIQCSTICEIKLTSTDRESSSNS